MRLHLIASVCLGWVTVLPTYGQGATRAGGTSEAEKPLQITLELRDGSKLVGTPTVVSLPIKTEFAKMDLPVKLVASIEFADDKQTAKIQCTNGDELKGVINVTAVTLSTAFDKVSIPLKNIARISTGAGSVKKGCILYYSFDKNEGERVTDKSGKSNHGKVHGTTWTAHGRVGGACTFNGESDYLSIAYNEKCGLFPTDAPLSVAAWFKTSSASPMHQTIAATHFAGIGRDGYFLMVDTRDYGGKAFWAAFTPAVQGAIVTSKSAVNDGQWHHAVGVWDGKENLLYMDGVLQGKATATGSLVYEHRASLRIGHVENNGAPHARDESFYFKGTIDEVMIFDRALTAEEIRQLYRHSKANTDSE